MTPGLSTGTAADHDHAPPSGLNLNDRGPIASPHSVTDSSLPASNLPACADSGCLNQMASVEPSGLPRTTNLGLTLTVPPTASGVRERVSKGHEVFVTRRRG